MAVKAKKILKVLRKNYFVPFFLAVILFVGLVVFAKAILAKPKYVYVRVKVGQGLWWASTIKPSIWLANALKEGQIKYDLFGKPEAEILEVRRYPATASIGANSQYDVYVTLILKVNQNKKTKEYLFDRNTLSIGSAVDVQFPEVDMTGAVTDISSKEFRDEFVDKTVYLVSQSGYNKDFPYRYDNIVLGDKYFDGKENVLEVLDKSIEKNIWSVQNNFTAQIYERDIETTQNIVVKVKMRLKKRGSGLYYGEDYKISVNSYVPLATQNYNFDNFAIRKIE